MSKSFSIDVENLISQLVEYWKLKTYKKGGGPWEQQFLLVDNILVMILYFFFSLFIYFQMVVLHESKNTLH